MDWDRGKVGAGCREMRWDTFVVAAAESDWGDDCMTMTMQGLG